MFNDKRNKLNKTYLCCKYQSMSTKPKTTRTRKKKLTREDLIGRYMNAVLEHGEFPSNIYKFCKDQKIEESEFYEQFGSFDGLREGIWSQFHHMALSFTHKARGYSKMSAKDKLLTYYFTLFELLTANRSYVLFALDSSAPWQVLGGGPDRHPIIAGGAGRPGGVAVGAHARQSR